MLTVIDISNWQRGLNLTQARPEACIVKATEGVSFVDKTCDGFVQQCISAGIPFGYYHFANGTNGQKQAEYFYNNTKGYDKKGIPVLDFEKPLPNSFIDEFVKTYHDLSGVFPWVYMSSDYVNNRKYGSDYVKKNCGLWLAGYPKKLTTYPAGKECPYPHPGWTLAAWQFTDALSFGGMSIDGDIFYGDTSAWNLYANPDGSPSQPQAAPNPLDGLSDYHIARDVINGKYGNGAERRAALGARYDSVQVKVNLLLHASDYTMASAVIAGEVGTGEERKFILGERYNNIQRVVNRRMR